MIRAALKDLCAILALAALLFAVAVLGPVVRDLAGGSI